MCKVCRCVAVGLQVKNEWWMGPDMLSGSDCGGDIRRLANQATTGVLRAGETLLWANKEAVCVCVRMVSRSQSR